MCWASREPSFPDAPEAQWICDTNLSSGGRVSISVPRRELTT